MEQFFDQVMLNPPSEANFYLKIKPKQRKLMQNIFDKFFGQNESENDLKISHQVYQTVKLYELSND